MKYHSIALPFLQQQKQKHKFVTGTHVTVEDDGPYESEDDGGPSVYDI